MTLPPGAPERIEPHRTVPRARTPDFNEMLAAPGAFAFASEVDPLHLPRPATPIAETLPALELGTAAPIEPPAIERTPGSDFVLPANPLSDLTDDQLQGFVDCTLYEDPGAFDADGAVDAAFGPPADDPPVARRASRTMTPIPLLGDSDPARPFRSPTGVPFGVSPTGEPIAVGDPLVGPPGSYAPDAIALGRTPTGDAIAMGRVPTGGYSPEAIALGRVPTGRLPPRDIAVGRAATGEAIARGRVATGPLAPEQIAMGEAYARDDGSPDDPTRTIPPYGYPPQPPVAHPTGAHPGRAPATQPPAHAGAAPRPRWWLIAGSAAIALVLVVVALRLARSSDASSDPPVAPGAARERPPVTRPPGKRVAASDVKPPGPAPAPENPVPANPAPADPPPDDGTDHAVAGGLPVVGSGPCRVNVTVTPAGSQVKVDGEVMGPSPLVIDTPCERRRLDIAHARYAPITRWVTPVLDKPESLEVALVRPTHSLTVVSVPPGATVSIEGRRAGTTPTVVQLLGFYSVTLTIQKKGYKTATQRIYSRVPQDRVTVRLLESLK